MERLLYAVLGGGFSVLLVFLYRAFFGKSAGGLPINPGATSAIDSGVSDIRSGQQQATDAINRATGEARTVRENLGESGVIVEDIIATLKRDRDIIKRGREILEGLQKVDRKPTDGE